MRILSCKPLFAWEDLEDSPTLRTIREFLHSVPDAALLQGLREHRGKGRNEYPVGVLWGVVLLTIALRHPTHEACLAELRRNEGLRRLIGIASEDDVPKKWNLSRFLETLGQEPHLSRMQACFFAFIHAVLIVHAAFATVLASAPRREGTLSKASLSPIAKALRQKTDAPAATAT